MKTNITYLFIILILLSSCHERSFDLQTTLQQNDKLAEVLKEASQRNLQILLTEVERNERGVTFTEHKYNYHPNQYFYPASTVKLPLAILAMEYCETNKEITSTTPFKISTDTSFTTIRKEIEKIFAVSDNEAFNRLYELLGPDEVNSKMKEKGLDDFRLSHRLSVPNAAILKTGSCTFLIDNKEKYTTDSIQNSAIEPLQINNTIMGKGYYADDSLIMQPFDFSLKNRYALQAQHETMKRLFFPDNYPVHHRFMLSESDEAWLKETMCKLPRTLGYDEKEYQDSYVKFFLFGDSKDRMPEHIKIHNKVGYAYGHLTDNAYIKDEKTGLEFILTATILVNDNQIFNDDQYEYDQIGIPFLAELGRTIHRALNQKRTSEN